MSCHNPVCGRCAGLVCAHCSGLVAQGRCSACRAALVELHRSHPQLPAGAVLAAAALLAVLLLLLSL